MQSKEETARKFLGMRSMPGAFCAAQRGRLGRSYFDCWRREGGPLSPLSVSSKSARPQTEEVPRRNVGHQNSDLHWKDRLLLAFLTVLLGSPHDLDPGCNKSRSLPSQVAC